MNRLVRKTTDESFEHVARTLLPFAVDLCMSLKVENIIPPGDEHGEHCSELDIINAIQIVAEVAEAFSIERYGKLSFRVAAKAAPALDQRRAGA